jgi:hypothetical protein
VLEDVPKPANGRLGDILKPLLQVIRLTCPEREIAFLRLVGELEQQRMIEKSDSLEGEILVTMIRLADQVDKGGLPVKLITDEINRDRSERAKISYQRVGRKLNAMGFKKGKTDTGASAVVWDQRQLEKVSEKYGLRETSETPEQSPDVTDVSEVSDVFGKRSI